MIRTNGDITGEITITQEEGGQSWGFQIRIPEYGPEGAQGNFVNRVSWRTKPEAEENARDAFDAIAKLRPISN
jgi:hypothetical protein